MSSRNRTTPRVCPSLIIALIWASWLNAQSPEQALTPTGHPGWINVSSFGAKGNGQTDDTGAIQKAIGAAKESGSKLYFPKGDYQITQTIQIAAHGLQMEGAGPDHTRIIAGAEMDRMCYLLGSNVVISHMSFDGNNTAKYGVHPFHLNGPGSKLAFLSVYRARSHGFFLDHSQLLEVTHCTSEHNGGDGFYVTDCNASVIRSCRARGNEGRGLTITSTDYSGGCTVLDCNVETHPSNRSAGAEYVLVTAAHGTPVVIKRLWAEGRRNNLYDAIRITSPSVMLAESRISLGGDSSVRARHSIHLASDTLVHLEQTHGDFRPGEEIRAEPSGATAIVSFWQALPSWSDAFPIPTPYKGTLDRPRKLVLMEVSGQFQTGDILVGTVSDARGSIKSTSIASARNCVIKDNWLAREQAASPPARIYMDAGLSNHVGKNYSQGSSGLIPVIEE